jgi:hypothetical protein
MLEYSPTGLRETYKKSGNTETRVAAVIEGASVNPQSALSDPEPACDAACSNNGPNNCPAIVSSSTDQAALRSHTTSILRCPSAVAVLRRIAPGNASLKT